MKDLTRSKAVCCVPRKNMSSLFFFSFNQIKWKAICDFKKNFLTISIFKKSPKANQLKEKIFLNSNWSSFHLKSHSSSKTGLSLCLHNVFLLHHKTHTPREISPKKNEKATSKSSYSDWKPESFSFLIGVLQKRGFFLFITSLQFGQNQLLCTLPPHT